MSQFRMDVVVRAGVWLSFAITVAAAVVGCAQLKPRAERLSPGGAVRMTAQPLAAMAGRRVSALLDFESPQDLTFIAADPTSSISNDRRVARSGRTSLSAAAGTREVAVKLPSLLSGRSFPADWTLIGTYVQADRPTQITMSYAVGERVLLSRSVAITAGVWTPVMLDLASLNDDADDAVGLLRVTFDPGSQANVHLDDVTLVDNHETVIDTTRDGGEADAWSVRRRGLYYVIDAPSRFAFVIPTSSAEQGGWSPVDACPLRVRFVSANTPWTMTVYADGRMYFGGEFRGASSVLRDAAEQAQQHASPAAVEVAETMGRLNRSSSGDENNDGYNESRGAYEIVASGPRVEMTITPRTAVLSRPVLEVSGLPGGNVMVTMEGTLVEGATRLSNGDVLVELPARIARPTQVSVRVQ